MIRTEARRVLRFYPEYPAAASAGPPVSAKPAASPGRSRRAPAETRRLVREHLAGLIACRRAWADLLLALLTRPLLRRLRAVEVDRASLLELRRLAGRGPIVFLPAHRSYGDSLVLAAALRGAGFARPWRLAGENLAFWPLGPIGRRSGTIFIRREFGVDPAYHAAVRCYLADLLARAQSIEWFPEAGRSRTGRQRKLRTGMLRILIGAYTDSGVEDVRVVPVSIVYDALPDMESVTAQDAGAAKRPEGLRSLIRYLYAGRTLGPRRAWMAFGEPLSLREVVRSAAGEWDAARILAKRVAAGLRDATQVTAESLLALVFPPDGGAALGAEDVARRVATLLEYAVERRIPVCAAASIESALEGLVRMRALSRSATGFAVESGRQRLLAYHRCVAEQWFLPRAAAELVAAGATTARRLGLLLAPLDASCAPGSAAFERRVEAELAALGEAAQMQPFLLAPRLLGPVFDAYYAVALSPETQAECSAELRGAALAVLGAEGLLGPGVDACARAAFVCELGCLRASLRVMAALEAARPAGGTDVRR